MARKLIGHLSGFGVTMKNLHSNGYRSEYWAYDPYVLSQKQRKMLGVIAWRPIRMNIYEGDNG